jgi:hypothetical protein
MRANRWSADGNPRIVLGYNGNCGDSGPPHSIRVCKLTHRLVGFHLPRASRLPTSSLCPFFFSRLFTMSAFDEYDDRFMDSYQSDDDDDDPASVAPHSTGRPPASIVSGTSGLSHRSKPSQMPPPHARAFRSTAHLNSSGLSPDLIARLTSDELLHNNVFLRAQEKIRDLEHTLSEVMCEVVKLRRTQSLGTIGKSNIDFFALFG